MRATVIKFERDAIKRLLKFANLPGIDPSIAPAPTRNYAVEVARASARLRPRTERLFKVRWVEPSSRSISSVRLAIWHGIVRDMLTDIVSKNVDRAAKYLRIVLEDTPLEATFTFEGMRLEM